MVLVGYLMNCTLALRSIPIEKRYWDTKINVNKRLKMRKSHELELNDKKTM